MQTESTSKPISKAAQKRLDRERAIERLRLLFPPGSTVHTDIVHVARSGMPRRVKVYAVEDGEVRNVSGMVATATESRWHDDGSIVVGGCGFDAGFHTVYDLACTLYRDGFTCTGKGCPSNDHSNGDRVYTPHQHSDPGYSLRHRSL